MKKIQKKFPEYMTNSGHGHVWRRPDGQRIRCGGPVLCHKCREDQNKLLELQEKVTRK